MSILAIVGLLFKILIALAIFGAILGIVGGIFSGVWTGIEKIKENSFFETDFWKTYGVWLTGLLIMMAIGGGIILFDN